MHKTQRSYSISLPAWTRPARARGEARSRPSVVEVCAVLAAMLIRSRPALHKQAQSPESAELALGRSKSRAQVTGCRRRRLWLFHGSDATVWNTHGAKTVDTSRVILPSSRSSSHIRLFGFKKSMVQNHAAQEDRARRHQTDYPLSYARIVLDAESGKCSA